MKEGLIETATIISVGDELLSGDVVNTNSAWLAGQMVELGINVKQIRVIPDDVGAIADAIRTEAKQNDLLIVTGGIGPTHDDITRIGLARALDKRLLINPVAEEEIRSNPRFHERMLVMAEMPEGSKPVMNEVGAAPGIMAEQSGCKIILMPGVPKEMEEMFESIRGDIRGKFPDKVRIITTTRRESAIADILGKAEKMHPGVKVGSYPQRYKKAMPDGRRYWVRIKVTSKDEEMLEKAVEWITERIWDEEIVKINQNHGLTI